MKNKRQTEALDQQEISETELNNFIGANKDLYNKLNELPEMEALDSIFEDEEINKDDNEKLKFSIS